MNVKQLVYNVWDWRGHMEWTVLLLKNAWEDTGWVHLFRVNSAFQETSTIMISEDTGGVHLFRVNSAFQETSTIMISVFSHSHALNFSGMG